MDYFKALKEKWNKSKDRRFFSENIYSVYSSRWQDSRDAGNYIIRNQPQRSIITNELAYRFPKTYDQLKLSVDTSINLLKWASEKIGNIYDLPAERSIDGNLITSYDTDDLQQFLSKICPLTYAIRNTFLRPIVQDGILKWDVIRGDQAEVITKLNSHFELEAIIYKLGDHYVFWSDEYHATFPTLDLKNPLDDPDNPEHLNPYGFVPIIPIHAEFPVGEFWDITGSNELYWASIETAIALTNFRRLQQLAAHKQPWIKGDPKKDFDRFAILDPAYPIVLRGANAAVGVVDLQANLKDQMNTILDIAASILHFMGFNPRTVRGDTVGVMSGYALKLENSSLEAVRNKQRTNWRSNEIRMVNVARKVVEVEKLRPENAKMESIPEGELLITFGDTTPEANPTELKDYWQDRFMKGTSEQYEVLMHLDGLDEDFAREKANILKSEQASRLAASVFAPALSPDDLPNDIQEQLLNPDDSEVSDE